jgi:hypothetical protein
MALPVSFYSITMNDNTLNPKTGQPETANFEVPTTTITAGNLAAQTTAAAAFAAAVEGITIGVLGKTNLDAARTLVSSLRAASTLAQRENKWLCRYIDAVTQKKFRINVPTADLTLLPDGSEFLDLADGAVGEAFKTAFEAFVKSPDDPTHAVTLISAQFVGRNS